MAIDETETETKSEGSKRATGNRWSSRYNACSSFKNSWEEFMETLNDIENNNSEKHINRRKAAG